MLFDWFTVIAQAFNFLVLVWLMKRYLYKPVLHAIDEREKRVAAELANADKTKAEAEAKKADFEKKNEEFDSARSALMMKANDDAQKERERLLDDARKAADALNAKRMDAMRTEAISIGKDIRRRAQQEVFSIARKTLVDLASASLEEHMTAVFVQRIQSMDAKAKQAFAVAITQSADPVLLRSAFDVPEEQRAVIQKALNETFSADVHITYETKTDVVGGIELSAHGQKIAWTIEDYLSSMEDNVDALIAEGDKQPVKTVPNQEVKAEATKT